MTDLDKAALVVELTELEAQLTELEAQLTELDLDWDLPDCWRAWRRLALARSDLDKTHLASMCAARKHLSYVAGVIRKNRG